MRKHVRVDMPVLESIGASTAGGGRCGTSGWLAHRTATVGRPGRQSGDVVSAFPWGENGRRKPGAKVRHEANTDRSGSGPSFLNA